MKDHIDKLAWILIKDRSILRVRSKNKDVFYNPGGKRDEDESDQEALIREIKEELDVDLIEDTIKYINTFEAQAHGKPEGTVVRVTCYSADYVGELKPSSEIEELAWFKYADKHKLSPVDESLFDWLKENDLID